MRSSIFRGPTRYQHLRFAIAAVLLPSPGSRTSTLYPVSGADPRTHSGSSARQGSKFVYSAAIDATIVGSRGDIAPIPCKLIHNAQLARTLDNLMAHTVADAPSGMHEYEVQQHLNRLPFGWIDRMPSVFSGLVNGIHEEISSRQHIYLYCTYSKNLSRS